MKDLTKALSLGITVCACMVVPTLLGVLADKHFQTAPLWVLAGVGFGLAGAFQTLRELIK
ncbi:MAG: AtpZ/AtpI family protein [Erysipelotrichaceae bacterium]|nr:AtpZ/AtpI family protein [Erysipelotrichaceae bacterium]